MLHKVTIAYFREYEDGRKRPDFFTAYVEAETGDEAAAAALAVYSDKLPGQAEGTRVGVQGVDIPSTEEIEAQTVKEEPKRGRKEPKAD